MIRVFFSLYLGVQCLSAQELCTQVLHLDCDSYVPEENEGVCGNNGVSYHNYCQYAQAKCRDPTVDIHYVGLCIRSEFTTEATNLTDQSENSTTVQSENLTTVQSENLTTVTLKSMTTVEETLTTDKNTDYDPLQHVFCTSVMSGAIQCTEELDPYCGTDDNFYKNRCYFEAEKCRNRNLLEKPLDMCKGPIPSKRQ